MVLVHDAAASAAALTLHALADRLQESQEQRVGAVGAGEEFGVELAWPP